MFRRLRTLLAIGGLVGLALIVAPAAVVAGDPCYHGYTIPPTTSEATTTVNLEPCAFVPTAARVAPGATVTFANVSEMPHLVTGANASWGDRDAEMAAGASRMVTFDRPGIYPFSCALHRGMTGVIVVGNGDLSEAAAAAPTSTAGTDQAVVLAMSGLGGLAALGWAVVFLQRRRINPQDAQTVPTTSVVEPRP
jgi:plastocyanin